MAISREGLVPTLRTSRALHFTLDDGTSLQAPVERYYCMGRFDLSGFPRRKSDDRELRSFEELLDALLPGLDLERRRDLEAELTNGRDKLVLAFQALGTLGHGRVGEGSLGSWEGRVWLGHPLHPGCGLRLGVTDQENRMYGPEWGAQLQLRLLMVPCEDLVEVGDFTRRFLDLFPELKTHVPSGTALLPVHPWQADRDAPSRFSAQLQSGRWSWSPYTVPARPTMSFRTVILESPTGRDFHLKLPVNVQTTGAVRTVSVAAAQNGPRVSAFMRALVEGPFGRSSRMFEHFHLMYEDASFYVSTGQPEQSRFLAGLLREGPFHDWEERKDRWILPVAALLEPRDNPLMGRVGPAYGLSHRDLWRAYLRSLLPTLAVLCGRLGIALEAHPQNLLVEFRGPLGQSPEIHFWYRDFGGIRFHQPSLRAALHREPELKTLEAPTFWPDSATTTECFREASSKFIYSVLQNHLGELIRVQVRDSDSLEEKELWTDVALVLRELKTAMGAELSELVFAESWDLKAMWTMRVDRAVTEYTFSPVPNPLLASSWSLSQ